MKRLIKVSKRGLSRLNKMLQDIKKDGETGMCPDWNEIIDVKFKTKNENVIGYNEKLDNNPNLPYDCYMCKKLFPQIKVDEDGDAVKCPCESYTPKHIIKRLEEIIAFNK